MGMTIKEHQDQALGSKSTDATSPSSKHKLSGIAEEDRMSSDSENEDDEEDDDDGEGSHSSEEEKGEGGEDRQEGEGGDEQKLV